MNEEKEASRNFAGGEYDEYDDEIIPVFIEIKSSQNDMTGLGFFSELSEDMDPDELLEDAEERDSEPSGEYVFRTEGSLIISDRITLSYCERDDDGQCDSLTEISFAIDDPGVVMITRSLPESGGTSFVLEKGKRYFSAYATPYGAMDLCVYAKIVENSVNSDGGEINLVYSVELKGLTAQRTKMTVKVRRMSDFL